MSKKTEEKPQGKFNKAMFFDMGHTHTQQIRLDEIHLMNEQKARGEEPSLGDATAMDIVEEILKRAMILHKYPELVEPLAGALEIFVGKDPVKWQNPELGAFNG